MILDSTRNSCDVLKQGFFEPKLTQAYASSLEALWVYSFTIEYAPNAPAWAKTDLFVFFFIEFLSSMILIDIKAETNSIIESFSENFHKLGEESFSGKLFEFERISEQNSSNVD